MVIPPPSPVLAMFSFVPVAGGGSRFHTPLITKRYWGGALHRLDMVEPLVLTYMEKALKTVQNGTGCGKAEEG